MYLAIIASMNPMRQILNCIGILPNNDLRWFDSAATPYRVLIESEIYCLY